MKRNIADKEYAKKVTDAAVFAVDMIQRKRYKGMMNDYQVSQRLGAAKQTVHYWRNGMRAITVGQIGAMIKEFDISPNFLLKQEGNPWGEAELMLRMKVLEERLDKLELEVKNKKP